MKEGKLYTFFVTAENSDGKKSKAVAGPGSSIPEPDSHHKMEVISERSGIFRCVDRGRQNRKVALCDECQRDFLVSGPVEGDRRKLVPV